MLDYVSMQDYVHRTPPLPFPHVPTNPLGPAMPLVFTAALPCHSQACLPLLTRVLRRTTCSTIDLSTPGLAMQSAVSCMDVLASFASFSHSQLGATCRPVLLPPGKPTSLPS